MRHLRYYFDWSGGTAVLMQNSTMHPHRFGNALAACFLDCNDDAHRHQLRRGCRKTQLHHERYGYVGNKRVLPDKNYAYQGPHKWSTQMVITTKNENVPNE